MFNLSMPRTEYIGSVDFSASLVGTTRVYASILWPRKVDLHFPHVPGEHARLSPPHLPVFSFSSLSILFTRTLVVLTMQWSLLLTSALGRLTHVRGFWRGIV
jgi:hypothetical protein